MSSHEDDASEQKIEELVITGGTIPKRVMDEHFEQLPEMKLRRLTLMSCNYFNRGVQLFWPKKREYNLIFLYLEAIQNNTSIEVLELGPEFTRPFKPFYDAKRKMSVNMAGLIGMRSLKQLKLNNSEFTEQFFLGLLEYLGNPQCPLEILELRIPFTEEQLERLKLILTPSSSLKRYIGPYQERIQAMIDEKNQARDEQSTRPELLG